MATMFDLPGLDGVEEVVINREVAEGRANPLFLYGKERAEEQRLSVSAQPGHVARVAVAPSRAGDILILLPISCRDGLCTVPMKASVRAVIGRTATPDCP